MNGLDSDESRSKESTGPVAFSNFSISFFLDQRFNVRRPLYFENPFIRN
jgi:hypothetical protein